MSSILLLLSLLFLVSPGEARRSLHVALVPADSERTGRGEISGYARTLLEEELGGSGPFDLVERQRIDALLGEIAFQETGVTDTAGAAGLGRLLNVDLIFFVRTHRISSGYELAVEAVDVSTGRILRADRERLGFREERMRQGVHQLARRLAAYAFLFFPEEMVLLPAGRFLMGSDDGLPDEGPPHYVSVDSFYLDRYEVSRIAFEDFLVRQGRKRKADLENPDHPATMVSWSDAAGYCRSRGKRLPTEAEWEYAARGSEGRIYPWGNTPPTPFRACFQNRGTLPVDSLPEGTSPEGIHHLAGNVAEWVSDWYAPGYYAISPESNPQGPAEGDYRVVRGGSWNQSSGELRASAREYHNPDRGAEHIGFRCARDAPSAP